MENASNVMQHLLDKYGEDEEIKVDEVKVEETKTEQEEEKEEEQEEETSKVEEEQEEELEELDYSTFFENAGLPDDAFKDFKITDDTTLDDLGKHVKEYYENKIVEPLQLDEEVEDFLKFKKLGGSLEEFKAAPKKIDYDSIIENLTEDNLDDAEFIIRQNALNKGLSEKVVKQVINSLKDENELIVEAKKILETEKTESIKNYDDWKKQVDTETEKRQNEQKEIIKKVKSTIEDGVVSGLVLSKEEKSEFNEFLFVPESDGITKQQKVLQGLTLEQRLFIDLLIFNNFDISKMKTTEKIKDKSPIKVKDLHKTSRSAKPVGNSEATMEEYREYIANKK